MQPSPQPIADDLADSACEGPQGPRPFEAPVDYIGPLALPGTGRQVWWTGRVAIGLRYERTRHHDTIGQSGLWVQNVMLAPRAQHV